MIEIRHLRKEYGDSVPLRDINAVINDGDVIAVIGPSGTGKSTLLNCMNLLERPTSGQILLNGENITAEGCDVSLVRRKMGMVFQSYHLFGHMTAVENVMFAPVKLLHLGRQEAYDRAVELLRMVGLAEKQMNYPDQMSGGQQQRVAIARTLAMDPDIILFDEPTSALDPTSIGEVKSVIRELARQKKTMMIVTHEMQFAREVASRVFYMDEGLIYEEGTTEEIFENPQKEKTRRFLRRLRILELKIASRAFDFAGAVAMIDQYCYKNRILPKTGAKLQSVFEELCFQILLPALQDPSMHVTIEHMPSEEAVKMTVEYPGSLRPEETDSTIAYALVKANAESVDYEARPDGSGSVVTVRIR